MMVEEDEERNDEQLDIDDAWEALAEPFLWWQNIEIQSALVTAREPVSLQNGYEARAIEHESEGADDDEGFIKRFVAEDFETEGGTPEKTWKNVWSPFDAEDELVTPAFKPDGREDCLKHNQKKRAATLYLSAGITPGFYLGGQDLGAHPTRDRAIASKWGRLFTSALGRAIADIQTDSENPKEAPFKIPTKVLNLGSLNGEDIEAPVIFARASRGKQNKDKQISFLCGGEGSAKGNLSDSGGFIRGMAACGAYLSLRDPESPRPPFPTGDQALRAITEHKKNAADWEPSPLVSLGDPLPDGQQLGPAELSHEVCCADGLRSLRSRHSTAHSGDHETSRFLSVEHIPWLEEGGQGEGAPQTIWTDLVPTHEQVKMLHAEERCFAQWFNGQLEHDLAPVRNRDHAMPSIEARMRLDHAPYRIFPLIFHHPHSAWEFFEATVVFDDPNAPETWPMERMLELLAVGIAQWIADQRAAVLHDGQVLKRELDWSDPPERMGTYLWQEYGLREDNQGWGLPIEQITEDPDETDRWIETLAGGHEDWQQHWEEGLIPVPRGRCSFQERAELGQRTRFLPPEGPTRHIPEEGTSDTQDHLMVQGIPAEFRAWRVRIFWERLDPVDETDPTGDSMGGNGGSGDHPTHATSQDARGGNPHG